MALESKKRIDALIAEANECYGTKATNITEVIQSLADIYTNILDLSVDKEIEIKNNKVVSLRGSAFYRLGEGAYITKADFLKLQNIPSNAFGNQSKLLTLIIRSETLCTLASISAFGDYNAYLKIYVPSALIGDYKKATNWTYFSDKFRALEDYTVDGTITGALDESKI